MSLTKIITRLFSPCFMIGHQHLLFTRVNNVLNFECERCHQIVKTVLASEVITTPLPQSVSGAVTTKATKAHRISSKQVIVRMRNR